MGSRVQALVSVSEPLGSMKIEEFPANEPQTNFFQKLCFVESFNLLVIKSSVEMLRDILNVQGFQDYFKGFCNEKQFSTQSRNSDIDKIALRAAT